MKFKIPVLVLSITLLLALYPMAIMSAETGNKSDIWLEAQLITAYTLNEHLNPFKLDVDVEDGMATLSGAVDNDVERDLAIEIAKGVDGIRDVKDKISVESEEFQARENQPTESGLFRKVEDATITAKVKSRLLWNQNTEGLEIDVDTKNNVVTLTGRVKSDAERDLVVQIAGNTTGVRRVKENLIIPTEKGGNDDDLKRGIQKVKTEVSDAWITTKVETQLFFSEEAVGSDIDVSTTGGVVMLKGTVTSEKQREKIISLVKNGRYVKDVKTDLAVASASM